MATAPVIRLDELVVKPFEHSASLNQFDCGRQSINRWLKNKAKKACARHEHKAFLAFLPSESCPVGYYALQLGSDSVSALASRPSDYLQKNYVAFPAVHISYLAVRSDMQRKGIGSYLFANIIDKVYAISENAGVYALTLQSIDAKSTAFYTRLGFVPYSVETDQPKMLLPIKTLRELVEGA